MQMHMQVQILDIVPREIGGRSTSDCHQSLLKYKYMYICLFVSNCMLYPTMSKDKGWISQRIESTGTLQVQVSYPFILMPTTTLSYHCPHF